MASPPTPRHNPAPQPQHHHHIHQHCQNWSCGWGPALTVGRRCQPSFGRGAAAESAWQGCCETVRTLRLMRSQGPRARFKEKLFFGSCFSCDVYCKRLWLVLAGEVLVRASPPLNKGGHLKCNNTTVTPFVEMATAGLCVKCPHCTTQPPAHTPPGPTHMLPKGGERKISGIFQ